MAQQKTPGVYITEKDAFPPSIVGVQTAVPAFIGYTEKAEIAGKPIFNKPQMITSFAEYVSIFGNGFNSKFNITENADVAQISLVDESGTQSYYQITQSSDDKFNLYASMKLFYDNGGEECYIVSVGRYTDTSDPPEISKISEESLATGLDAIADIVGPTILVCPDAVLLQPDTKEQRFESTEFNAFWKKALKQCGELQDRVAIIDVYGGQLLDQTSIAFKEDYEKAIQNFRNGIGTENLSYGVAYFPYLQTTAYPLNEVNYTYFDATELQGILAVQAKNLYGDRAKQLADAEKLLMRIETEPSSQRDVDELNNSLHNAFPILNELEAEVARQLGILPPSGGMAGIYTHVDATRGVWSAPANISMKSVIASTININNEMQEDLNVPLDGESDRCN